MEIFRVVNWYQHFETHRTRELKRLDWVPIPNKHDGYAFSELMDHPNGLAHYGAWVLLVQVASKCDVRGTLLHAGNKAHTAHSLARVTRSDEGLFAEALPRLVELGWLEVIPSESVGSDVPATLRGKIAPKRGKAAAVRGRVAGGRGISCIEGKGMEGNGTIPPTPCEGGECEVPPSEDLVQGNGIKTGGGGGIHRGDAENAEGGGNLARMELRYPGTAEEVVDYGAKLNPPVGEDRCRAFFAHYAGTAQVDPNGRLVWVTSGGGVVTNWRAKLPGFRGSEFGNSPQRRGERGEEGEEAGAEPGWVVVKRLQEAIEGNVANAQGTSYRPGVRDADPERWAEALERLRRDKAEIRRLRAKG